MKKPKIMAHKAGDCFGPENSLQALKETLKHKPDIIEIDIRKSSDNVLFCFHGNLFEVILKKIYFKKQFRKLKQKYKSVSTLKEIIKLIQDKTEIYLDVKDYKITNKDLEEAFKNIKTKQVYVGAMNYNFLKNLQIPKEWKKSLVNYKSTKINIKKIKEANISIIQLFRWNSTKRNLKELKENNVEFVLTSWFLSQKRFIKEAIRKDSLWLWNYNLPNLIKKLKE